MLNSFPFWPGEGQMDMTQQHYSTQAPIPGSPGLTQTRISGETRTQAQHSIQFAGLMWYLSTENQEFMWPGHDTHYLYRSVGREGLTNRVSS